MHFLGHSLNNNIKITGKTIWLFEVFFNTLPTTSSILPGNNVFLDSLDPFPHAWRGIVYVSIHFSLQNNWLSCGEECRIVSQHFVYVYLMGKWPVCVCVYTVIFHTYFKQIVSDFLFLKVRHKL